MAIWVIAASAAIVTSSPDARVVARVQSSLAEVVRSAIVRIVVVAAAAAVVTILVVVTIVVATALIGRMVVAILIVPTALVVRRGMIVEAHAAFGVRIPAVDAADLDLDTTDIVPGLSCSTSP